MAGLKYEHDRGREGWRLRFYVNRKRKSIWLGQVSESVAKTWKEHIEHLSAIGTNGVPSKGTTAWIATLDDELYTKLVTAELCEPKVVPPPPKAAELGKFIDSYLASRRSELKPASWTVYQHTRNRLIEHFGADRDMATITAADARAFREWLEKSSNKRDTKRDELAVNTVRRRTGICRHLFERARIERLVTSNPFIGLPSTVRGNEDRQHYIDIESFTKAFQKAPNARWRSLLVLARIGALRVPSEVAGLKWEHIDWTGKRLRIVLSSKTARHKKRKLRIVPLLPAIETELTTLKAEADEGEPFVFPGITGDTNLRKGLEKILKDAEVPQWPRLWQNLRASGATDFAKKLPMHVAAAICGHTAEIAREHYWQVTESDLDEVMGKLGGPICGPISSQIKAVRDKSEPKKQAKKKGKSLEN